jgi:Tfp pilus assembly protein PilF/energy-coupling factor transporter ATP-binding protein EcfA2
MSERNELFDQLKRQNESQFEELLLRLKVDKSHIRWSGATLSQKALDLIGYLEQQEDGLQRLQERLEREKPDDIALILACPYRELFAFQEEHAEFFFGRSGFINDLVQAVKTKPLVAVVGASGSGKSSLVFAGLLPRLRQEGSWLIESFRPEKQPFNRLAAAFVHQLEPELGKSDRIDKAINLANTIKQHGFAYVLSEILQEHPGKQLLLVVDQFEELYTLCAEEERDRFIDVLLAGINDSLGLKVVLTLRADFCGQAYTCRSLADALQSADLKLGSMNGEELREAIERPAQLMEVELEEKLTERLLEDVKQEPGNLPLLEFALTELWKKQRQRRLTHQAYAEIGGVAKALANHAETVYAKLNEAQQKLAQRIFLQLVHPGEGTEDTRRLATRGEVGADNWELVTHLAGASARLVVTGRNEETQEETVEIVHEALLREWKQLRDWMKSDRTFRIWQEELRSRRRRWQHNEQNEEDLLTGSLLSAAEVWLHERQADLSPEDGEFIRLSVEVRDRKELEKLSIQIELETERKQKEAAEQANQILVKAQRKAKQIVRFGFATMSLSMMLGILFIIVLPWSAIFFNDRGYEKLQSGQIKDALQDFNLALTLKPGYPTALYNRGLVYETYAEFDLAIANYESAVRERFAKAYINLARLQITRRNYTQAAKLLEEALPLETDNGTKYSLFKNLGWVQLHLHQYSQAEVNLQKAIAIDTQRGSAYCLLAQVIEAEEGKGNAQQQWDNCLAFGDPNHPDESEWIELAKSKLKK